MKICDGKQKPKLYVIDDIKIGEVFQFQSGDRGGVFYYMRCDKGYVCLNTGAFLCDPPRAFLYRLPNASLLPEGEC